MPQRGIIPPMPSRVLGDVISRTSDQKIVNVKLHGWDQSRGTVTMDLSNVSEENRGRIISERKLLVWVTEHQDGQLDFADITPLYESPS